MDTIRIKSLLLVALPGLKPGIQFLDMLHTSFKYIEHPRLYYVNAYSYLLANHIFFGLSFLVHWWRTFQIAIQHNCSLEPKVLRNFYCACLQRIAKVLSLCLLWPYTNAMIIWFQKQRHFMFSIFLSMLLASPRSSSFFKIFMQYF